MEKLKPHLNMSEAMRWIHDNAHDIRFLHANRNLSTETVARKLSQEVQRGMLARHEMDNANPRDVLGFCQSIHEYFNTELIKVISNVVTDEEEEETGTEVADILKGETSDE